MPGIFGGEIAEGTGALGEWPLGALIGRPLLHNGKQDGLTQVFTEREPCKKNPECARWLGFHFENL